MTLPYVYKLIDSVTGKWYIGSRTAKGCHPSEIGVKYFSSSKLVDPLYRVEPSRFKAEILVQSADPDYIIKVESDMLKFRNAKSDDMSFNMWDSDGKFNPSKAAYLTVAMKVGVHNRTPEELIAHARMGGLKGGKIGHQRGNSYVQRLSKEELQKIGRHLGLTQPLEQKIANGKKVGTWCKENKIGFCGMSTEQRVANGKKASIKKYVCGTCGKAFNGGNLFQHQRASGHSGKGLV